MKGKNLIDVSKRFMAGCLSVTMILIGIILVPKSVEAESDKTVHCDSTYQMGDYWTSPEKNKAPVKDGYVFAGWYNADGVTPLKAAELKEADNTAVAKFVPAEVLSIKTQKGIVPEDSTKASLRILSTVDSKNYQSVGFYYKLARNEEGKANFTKVYSAIKPYRGATSAADKKPGETFVDGVSKYFIAADVSDISSGSFARIVYARPYWITMDGTEVLGLARNSRVEDKDNGYESVGINLLPELVDKEYAAVAAGKIQVKYNTEYYDVVGTKADITADNSEGGVGGKYLFPEMECHIDEENGIITFVGNAVIQGETLTNLTADGLFANVRFVKATSNTENIALSYEIVEEATDFCNWAEAPVTKFVVQ